MQILITAYQEDIKETNKTIYLAFINFSDDPEMIPSYTQYKELEAYCQNPGVEMFCWVEASSEFTLETAQSINYVLREHCQRFWDPILQPSGKP